MRVEVAQQRVGDAAQAFRPGPEAVCAVYAETQNLGLDPFEPVQRGLVRRDLARSDGGPGQREEGQDDVLLAAIVAQAHRAPVVALEGEIRSDSVLLRASPVRVTTRHPWIDYSLPWCSARHGRRGADGQDRCSMVRTLDSPNSRRLGQAGTAASPKVSKRIHHVVDRWRLALVNASTSASTAARRADLRQRFGRRALHQHLVVLQRPVQDCSGRADPLALTQDQCRPAAPVWIMRRIGPAAQDGSRVARSPNACAM